MGGDAPLQQALKGAVGVADEIARAFVGRELRVPRRLALASSAGADVFRVVPTAPTGATVALPSALPRRM